MKFRKAICVPAMLMFFGAGMIAPRPVQAQQEVDPTTFDVNPGAPDFSGAIASNPQPGEATQVNAAVAPAPVEEAGMSPLDAIVVVALILCNGLVIILGIAVAMRRERRQIRAASAPYASAYRAL